jgi:hypothetical protein
MAVSFVDKNHNQVEVELNGLALYKEALKKGITLRQLINSKYETASDMPIDTFTQFCTSAGLRFSKDEETGIPAANLLDIFEGTEAQAGSFVNQAAAPDSRILFPAAVLEAIENKLQGKENIATAAFESLVGYRQTIATSKFEQPVLNYSGTKGPESAQFQAIGQNTRPPLMLALSASDVTRKVPTTSIGMEISREALASNSLDIVGLSLARFYKMADYNEWATQIGYLLSGDADAAVTSFSAGTSALSSFTAASLDSTIVAAGTLTQKAWLKFLYKNSMTMTKTHIICDFDTALAIENRSGRPTNVMNNAMDRLDVPFTISYPAFQSDIKIIVMPEGKFTANTIMGVDVPSPAIAKVTSSFSSYSAIEDVVMKKSTELRIDRGFLVYRMYDAAFNVMTLTV